MSVWRIAQHSITWSVLVQLFIFDLSSHFVFTFLSLLRYNLYYWENMIFMPLGYFNLSSHVESWTLIVMKVQKLLEGIQSHNCQKFILSEFEDLFLDMLWWTHFKAINLFRFSPFGILFSLPLFNYLSLSLLLFIRSHKKFFSWYDKHWVLSRQFWNLVLS